MAVLHFSQNRHPICSRAFKQACLCTSTCVVKVACKQTIGTHLKRSEMHWLLAHANAIAAPSCAPPSATGSTVTLHYRPLSSDCHVTPLPLSWSAPIVLAR